MIRCVATLLALFLSSSPVSAEDYGRGEESWNGIGYLETTGTEARVVVERPDTLDLSKLRPEQVLFWLYPRDEMPIADLSSFMREGGHLILADDHGAGAAFFERFGLQREAITSASVAHESVPFYRDRSHMPIVSAEPGHFLFFNVDEVVANHGVSLSGAGEVIMPIGATGQALIVEVKVGAGALLAVGDPSIFLNAMLRRFYGNKQLAANMMRYFCAGDPCRVTLVAPGTKVVGRYRSGISRFGAFPRIVDEAVTLINDSLARLDARLSRAPGPFLMVLASLLLALITLGGLLSRRGGVVTPIRASPMRAVSPQRHDARALVSGGENADFVEPVRTLLQELPEVALRQLLLRGPRSELAADHRRWKEAKAAVLRIQQEADSVRQAEEGPVGVERFLSLLGDVRDVKRYLDEGLGSPERRLGPERTSLSGAPASRDMG